MTWSIVFRTNEYILRFVANKLLIYCSIGFSIPQNVLPLVVADRHSLSLRTWHVGKHGNQKAREQRRRATRLLRTHPPSRKILSLYICVSPYRARVLFSLIY